MCHWFLTLNQRAVRGRVPPGKAGATGATVRAELSSQAGLMLLPDLEVFVPPAPGHLL